MKRFEHPPGHELEMLRQAVAASPILVDFRPTPSPNIPDWENVRHSNDVDAAVLAWIASHVRGTGHRRTH